MIATDTNTQVDVRFALCYYKAFLGELKHLWVYMRGVR